MAFTEKDLEQLKKLGRIRGFSVGERKQKLQETNGKVVSRHFKQRSKEKDWFAFNLLWWANNQAVTLHEEWKFSEHRKFRWDWAIFLPSGIKLGIEFHGGIFDRNGSHTSMKKMQQDIEKMNLANEEGWTVLVFTILNYKTLLQALKKYEK